MQPSELAKVALIIALAHYGERYQRHMPSFWRGMVIPGTAVAIVAGLVFVEPDVGTALLIGAAAAVWQAVRARHAEHDWRRAELSPRERAFVKRSIVVYAGYALAFAARNTRT